jgi:hypothetical protein
LSGGGAFAEVTIGEDVRLYHKNGSAYVGALQRLGNPSKIRHAKAWLKKLRRAR